MRIISGNMRCILRLSVMVFISLLVISGVGNLLICRTNSATACLDLMNTKERKLMKHKHGSHRRKPEGTIAKSGSKHTISSNLNKGVFTDLKAQII